MFSPLKPIKGSRIDLSEWTFNIDAEKIVGKSVTEAIRNTFKEHPPALFMPFAWGDRATLDPLTLDLDLPLNNDDSDETIYRTSLPALIGEVIKDLNGSYSNNDAQTLKDIGSALLSLGNKVLRAAERVEKSEQKLSGST